MRKTRILIMVGASALAGVLSLCVSDAAFAQGVPVATTVLNNPNDPNVQLANSLKTLAQNPYNVDALLSAGQGALVAGDPNAAIGFLARAEELSPRNPQVKVALGAALVQVERPQDALRIFGEAYSLGVLEYAFASDRGLANDLLGDNKAAQKDYAMALKAQRNDELVRRYALSLAISGEKSKALDLLEPLTRRGDQAAWRAKAFALALNGDMAGADRIVNSVVPANMIPIMAPFIRRLPSLTQAQRARAVHFGTMPAVTAPSLAVVDPGDSFRAMSNTQVASVVSPPVVTPAPVREVARRQETGAERRRREKQERELAKLAERGKRASNLSAPAASAQQAVRPPLALPTSQPPRQIVVAQPPVFPSPAQSTSETPQTIRLPVVAPSRPVAQPATAAATGAEPNPNPTLATSSRLGQRVGPVDPRVLDPYIVPSQQPMVSLPSQRPVLVDGARTLPSPGASLPAGTAAGTSPSIANPPRIVPASQVITPPLASNTAPDVATNSAGISTPIVRPATTALPTSASTATSVPVAPALTKAPQAQGSMAVSQGTTPVPSDIIKSPAITPSPAVTRSPAVTTAVAPTPIMATSPPVPVPAPAPQLGVIPPAAPSTVPSTNVAPTQPGVVPAVPSVALATIPTSPLPKQSEPVSIAVSVPSTPTQSPVIAKPETSGVQPSLAAPNPAPGFSLTSGNTQSASSSATGPIPTPSQQTQSIPALAEKPIETPPSTAAAPSSEVVAPKAAEASTMPAGEEPIGLGSIVAGLEVEEQSTAGPVPDEAEFRARQLAAKRKEEAAKAAAEREAKVKADALAKAEAKEAAETKAKELAAAKKKAEEEEAKKAEAAKDKANPARLWVQVATGANRGGLPITWRKLKQDAAKALEGQVPYSVAFRATNRLLVGPFKSAGDARTLITKLAKEDVFASLYASEAGQEIARLGAR